MISEIEMCTRLPVKLVQLIAQRIDLGATLTDDHARLRRVDRHVDAVRCTFNVDRSNRRVLQTTNTN